MSPLLNLELTRDEYDALAGIVARAALSDRERIARMRARPAGTHRPDILADAARNAELSASLEAKLGWRPENDRPLRVEGGIVQEFDPDSGLWFPARFAFDEEKTRAYVEVDGKRMTVWDFEQFHAEAAAS